MKTHITLYAIVLMTAAAALGLGITAALATPMAHAAGPWYVAPGGSDGNNCLSPATACASINGALGKPGFVAGDTVLVAVGTYTGTGTDVVSIYQNVKLSGGWDSAFTSQIGVSTIDGQASRRGIFVYSSVAVAVKRFAVQNGAAYNGAGIFNSGNLTLDDTFVKNNVVTGTHGGGIYNAGASSVVNLSNSAITSNTTSGIYLNDYGFDNPVKYRDPTGHCVEDACLLEGLALVVALGNVVADYGPQIYVAATDMSLSAAEFVTAFGDRAPGIQDQINQFAKDTGDAIQRASQGGNTAPGDPGRWRPDQFDRFTNLEKDKGFEELLRQANSSNSGEARGADRVLRLMGRLGDTVKNVNYKFTVTGLGSGDADVIDTNGVVHSVGGAGKVSDINAIADTTRELQRLRAWAGDDATIKFWYDGEGAGLDAIRAIAAKYNIDVEVLP